MRLPDWLDYGVLTAELVKGALLSLRILGDTRQDMGRL